MYQNMTTSRPDTDVDPRDSLKLGVKEKIEVLLANEGVDTESVLFSDQVIKLNAKGKQQERILMMTQHAIYNLKPKKLNKSQRRIRICDIGMVTLSSVSPEFAIHVPSEYDYHFISKDKDQIARLLRELYFKETKTKLIVVYSELKHLKDIVLTKKLAKFESRNSKHAMQQSISNFKDGLKNADDNEMCIDLNNLKVQGFEIVYSPVVDDENEGNNENNDTNKNGTENSDIAVYQSVVYGNDQLLLKQHKKLAHDH